LVDVKDAENQTKMLMPGLRIRNRTILVGSGKF